MDTSAEYVKDVLLLALVVVLLPLFLIAERLSPRCPRCGSRAKLPVDGLRRSVTDTDLCANCYYVWDRFIEHWNGGGVGMSKVYLVTWSDYENDTIYGIFSTRAAAEALVAEAVRHDPEHGKELDIDEEELDVPLEERGAQDVTFSSDGSAYRVPPFQWSTTASEVNAPSFYDVLGGMWCDRVVAQRLTVEVHAHSHDEGVAKATLLAGEIKAAVPWGDNDALAKWWQARQAGEERKCQQ